jgi:hypothetical protein
MEQTRLFRLRDTSDVVAVLSFLFVVLGGIYSFWTIRDVLSALEKRVASLELEHLETVRVRGKYIEKIDRIERDIERLERSRR